MQAQLEAGAELDAMELDKLQLPAFDDGVDLGGLYELSEILQKAGA